MDLRERVRQKFRSEAQRYKTPFLGVDQVDVKYDPAPIAENSAYCRLWLVEMRLARQVDWFQDRYPVVYAATRYQYGGNPVTVPYIAGVDYFKSLTKDNLDRVISLNYPLTPLFPYVRGEVELQAGLFSLKDSDLVVSFVEALSRLAKLLPVPQLSTISSFAEPLYQSMESLLGLQDNRLELGYQQTFAGAGGGGTNDLHAGYFAVILAAEQAFSDGQLRVVKDGLQMRDEAGPAGKALTGYSYMLFRLEKRAQQDWEALSDIKELVERAQDAILQKQKDLAQETLPAIKVAIARSPDVVRADRAAMYGKIEAELRDLGLQGRGGEVSKRSLFAIMQRPLTQPGPETQAEWARLEELYGPGRQRPR